MASGGEVGEVFDVGSGDEDGVAAGVPLRQKGFGLGAEDHVGVEGRFRRSFNMEVAGLRPEFGREAHGVRGDGDKAGVGGEGFEVREATAGDAVSQLGAAQLAAQFVVGDLRHEDGVALGEKRGQPGFTGGVFGVCPGVGDEAERATVQQCESHGLMPSPKRRRWPGRAASRPA